MAAGMFDISIDEVATNATGAIVEAIADKLTAPVIEIVSIILGFVGIFIVANILLAIVLAVINLIFKAGVLGIFNKLLGVIFGVAFALIVSWGIAILFNFVINVPAISELAWAQGFEGGYIYNLLNKYNPVELLLSF